MNTSIDVNEGTTAPAPPTRKERFQAAGLLVLRAAAGVGMTYHGFGKVFGFRMMPDGSTVHAVTLFAQGVGEMGLPAPYAMAWIAALSEFLGGILLIVGLGTRAAALFVAGTMFVAAFLRHKALHHLAASLGILAVDPAIREKWGNPELALAYLFASTAIVLLGGGKFSLDAKLFTKCPMTQKSDPAAAAPPASAAK